MSSHHQAILGTILGLACSWITYFFYLFIQDLRPYATIMAMTDHQLSTRFRLRQVGQYMRNSAIASSQKLRLTITPPPLLFHKKKS